MVDSLDFVDEVTISFSEPFQVAAFDNQRELFVLPYGSVLHLIHLVELALEQDKISASLGLLIY